MAATARRTFGNRASHVKRGGRENRELTVKMGIKALLWVMSTKAVAIPG